MYGHYVNMLICEVFGGFSPTALASFRDLARRKRNGLHPLHQTWTARRTFTAYHAQRISMMVNYYAVDEILIRHTTYGGEAATGKAA